MRISGGRPSKLAFAWLKSGMGMTSAGPDTGPRRYLVNNLRYSRE